MLRGFKKTIIIFFLAIFFAINVFGLFGGGEKVKAIPVEDFPLLNFQVYEFEEKKALEVKKEVKETLQQRIEKALTVSVLGALSDGISYFTRKLAYDLAVWVSEGGKGQGALIYKDGFGDYLKGVASDTVGETVGALGEPFGLNLCQIPDPRFEVFLQIGLRSIFPDGTEPKPKCSWQELEKSWGDIGNVLENRYGPGGSKLTSRMFNANLKVTQSDFGITMGAIGQVDEIKEAAVFAKQLQRIADEGVKSVTSLISGEVKTPSKVVSEQLSALSPQKQAEMTAEQVAGLYSAPLEEIPLMAGRVFLNTLASKLLSKLAKGLFSDEPDKTKKNRDLFSGFFSDSTKNTGRNTRQVLGFLKSPNIVQKDNYNILDEFASCPTPPGLNNCVIDTGLRQALTRNSLEEAYTIQKAIDEGLLHKEWELIPPSHALNQSEEKTCYFSAYCYSNIQKLRKVLILPLGFELAALKSDPDNPWTLEKVVNGFSNCNDQGQADSANPFCHLIDPNWILKIPQLRCQYEATGPELVDSKSPARRSECMDIQACISENDSGLCNAWGYCTKEKNIWRLPGDSCPAQYNTCTTYTNVTSREKSSYLARTVDFGKCTVESAGCSAYSTEYDFTTSPNGWKTAGNADISLKQVGRNQMLYLNKNVEICSASANGCTAFYGALRDPLTGLFQQSAGRYGRDSTNLINLKKAPDYLGCYDVDTVSNLTIEWPQTRAQAIALPGGECNNFARACAPSEVGCDLFTPADGGDSLPGVVSADNACVSECVGYETFKQEESSFEAEEFPLYFVSSLATQCSAAEVSCDQFTNLEAAAVGGESLQYYSAVRYCEKPAGTNEKTFFSWEGSDRGGYVLRNHDLKPIDSDELTYINGLALVFKGSDNVATVFPVGSPDYSDDTKNSLQDKYNRCNESAYNILTNDPLNAGAADPDCRAFYDNVGNIYYRLLADTVVISNSCQRLRKTESRLQVDNSITDQNSCNNQGGNWVGGACQRCYAGGVYDSGACIYQALPSESGQCSSSAAGCRAYTGNSGNNLNPNIIYDSFEGNTADILANWYSAPMPAISSESIQSAQHSLRASASPLDRKIPANTLRQNAWYELVFWARGVPQVLEVSFEQGGTLFGSFTNSVQISLGNEWREYRLGPVQFTGDANNLVNLRFNTLVGANVYFLDNIHLGQLEDRLFLIKNSWQQVFDYNGETIVANAPRACFAANQDPRTTLPGAALGCREYQDGSNNTYYTTGFASLCREDAIGCQPVWDSYNTVGEVRSKLYNAVCNGLPNSVCEFKIVVNGDVLGTCNIPQGETSCFVDEVTLPQGMFFDALDDVSAIDISTVYVPYETSNPVFLTNREEFQCQDAELGCMRVGEQDHSLPGQNVLAYDYQDTYIINNPAKYGDTLCRQELVGCNEYSAGANNYYFKDPRETGNTLCSYRDDVNGASGWFKDGFGECGGVTDQLCASDADCSSSGQTCDNIGSVPCYPNYQQSGDVYGIWSNESRDYRGYAGVCPSQYNACVELIDLADTSGINPDGKPYYRLDNNNLKEKVGDCNSQVSLKEGCVLFDQTNNPNKLYDSVATYFNSENAEEKYDLVDLVMQGNLDTNRLLKVERDRECSEWLACTSEIPLKNDKGEEVRLCSQYRACNESGPNQNCVNFAETDLEVFLDEKIYTGRKVAWNEQEYTGYSLLNKYPVSKYSPLSLQDESGQYLAYRFSDSILKVDNNNDNNPDFPEANCDGKTEGESCGFYSEGICYFGQCIVSIDGGVFTGSGSNLTDIKNYLLPSSCKGYPEEDSPYPSFIGSINAPRLYGVLDGQEYTRNTFTNNPSFREANVCQDGRCSCEYEKYIYENNITDYYSAHNSALLQIPQGVCIGERDGYPCLEDLDCGSQEKGGNTCQLLKTKETHLGLQGFCLERDLSRPINGKARLDLGEKQDYACLTWLPIQTSASSFDSNNRFLEAGYYPNLDAKTPDNTPAGEVMCVSATNSEGNFDTELFPEYNLDLPNFSINGMICQYFNCIDTNLSTYEFDSDNFSNETGLIPFYYDFSTVGEPYQYSLDSLFILPFSTYNALDLYSEPGFSFNANSDNARRGDLLAKLMQVWAWKVLGKNSTMLRTEYWRDGDTKSFFGSNAYNKAHLNGQNKRSFYDPFSNVVNMHPPRIWNNLPGCSSYFYSVGTGSNGVDIILSTTELAPGYILNKDSNGDCSTDFSFRSGIEEKLNEKMIDKIYFVPIGYPNGFLNMLSPQMMQKGFNIDFKRLQKEESFLGNYVASIRASVDSVLVPAEGIICVFAPIVCELAGTRLYSTGFRFHLKDMSNSLSSEFNFGFSMDNAGLRTMNYVLHRNNNDSENLDQGLLSYYDYESLVNKLQNPSTEPVVGTLMDPVVMRDERNQIYSRYVSVLFHSNINGEWPEFFTGNEYIPSKDKDPFTTACKSDSSISWLAIGMDFNKDGEFLGYITKSCMPEVNFSVIATSPIQCLDFAQVHDESQIILGESINKAKTQLVWSNSRDKDDRNSAVKHPSFFTGVLRRDQPNQPFGSLRLNSIDMERNNYLMGYSFRSKEYGIPYSCLYSWTSTAVTNGVCSLLKNSKYNYNIALVDALSSINSKNIAFNAIKVLFPKVFLRKEYEIGSGQFIISSTDDTKNYSDFVPTVYSLNPYTCNEDNNEDCSAGDKDNMSVGRKNGTLKDYDGDGAPDEDANRDRSADAIVAVSAYTADLEFFAMADDNHMPIKRVTVDWGDGEMANENVYGFYKNHKPFCSTDTSGVNASLTVNLCEHFDSNLTPQYSPTTLTCKDNTDCPVELRSDNTQKCLTKTELEGRVDMYSVPRFGNAQRACTPEPFKFVHTYSCNLLDNSTNSIVWVKLVQNLTVSQQNDLRSLGLSGTDSVCVFKPKVQVLDNWGFCNGFCSGEPAGDLCYSENRSDSNGECLARDSASGDNPWTEYQGTIIVVPKE